MACGILRRQGEVWYFMETNNLLAKYSFFQDYRLGKIYVLGAIVGILIPFGYYMCLGWISTHTGEPAAAGIVRVPNFDVLATAALLSTKLEQLWLLVFGIFLLCTGTWYTVKKKQFFWRRLLLAVIALYLAIANCYYYIYSWLANWLLGGRY